MLQIFRLKIFSAFNFIGLVITLLDIKIDNIELNVVKWLHLLAIKFFNTYTVEKDRKSKAILGV